MTLIISKKGGKSVKVKTSPFGMEEKLQEYIHQNPDAIPLYEIKEDIRLLILVREFPTDSGPVDAFGIDKDGEIYLIETKLYKNQDKRQVVAQVLDYGASLWSSYHAFDEFVSMINRHMEKQLQTTLRQKLSDHFGIDDEEIDLLLSTMKVNLRHGNFKFVVLMDSLDQQLKDLILFINQNSEFDIFAVELEYYKHQDFEITIPKLYGTQVKKDVSNVSKKRIPSDDEFISAYSQVGKQKLMKDLLKLMNDLQNGRVKLANVRAKKTPKYLNYYVDFKNGTLSMSLCINPDYEGRALHFWANKELWTAKNYQSLLKLMRETLPGIAVDKPLATQYGKIAKWPLDKIAVEKFTNFLKEISKL